MQCNMQDAVHKYIIPHTGERENQKQDIDHPSAAIIYLHGHTQLEGECKHESKDRGKTVTDRKRN